MCLLALRLAAVAVICLLSAVGTVRQRTYGFTSPGRTMIAHASPPAISPQVAASPTASVSPTTGVPGATVAITGAGFAPFASMQVTMEGTVVPPTSLNPPIPVTTSQGDFTAALTVPFAYIPQYEPPGDKRLVVTDGANYANAVLTIIPRTITVSPSSVSPSSSVTVTGAGWRSGASIRVAIDSGLAAVAASRLDGSFLATLNIPANLGQGTHSVTAKDTADLQFPMAANTTFTIAEPTITVTPSTASPGATVLVQGSNFAASAALTRLTIGGFPAAVPPLPSVDQNGSFVVQVMVPNLNPGTAFVLATAGVSAVTTVTIQMRATSGARRPDVTFEALINNADPTQSILNIAWVQDVASGVFLFFAPGTGSTITSIDPNVPIYLNLSRPARLQISGREPVVVPAGGRWVAVGDLAIIFLAP